MHSVNDHVTSVSQGEEDSHHERYGSEEESEGGEEDEDTEDMDGMDELDEVDDEVINLYVNNFLKML